MVYIGKIVVGYIYATVIDGIVIAATGKSGAEWVSIAIKNVVGKNILGKYICLKVVHILVPV